MSFSILLQGRLLVIHHAAIFERGTTIYSLRRKIRLVVARKPQGAVGIFEPVVFPTIKEKAKLKRLLGNASASSPSLSVVRLFVNSECETHSLTWWLRGSALE